MIHQEYVNQTFMKIQIVMRQFLTQFSDGMDMNENNIQKTLNSVAKTLFPKLMKISRLHNEPFNK